MVRLTITSIFRTRPRVVVDLLKHLGEVNDMALRMEAFCDLLEVRVGVGLLL